MAHDVFISYASGDSTVAEQVCTWLEARNIRCWMAPRDVKPGQNFAEAVLDAIDEASVFILIFSANANKSPHVIGELDRARTSQVPIVPFRIDTSSPSRAMQYYIAMYQWLDASKPPLRKYIPHLIETIQEILTQKQAAVKTTEQPEADKNKAAIMVADGKGVKQGKKLPVKIIAPVIVALLVFAGIYYFVIRPGGLVQPAPSGDIKAFVVENILATSIAEDSASITWSTDEPATGSVEYGENESFSASSPLDEMLTTEHNISLTDLDPNTTYFYRVRSQDSSGNEVISETYQLTTLPPSKVWELVFNIPFDEDDFISGFDKSYAEMIETATKGQVKILFSNNDPLSYTDMSATLESGIFDICLVPQFFLLKEPYLPTVTELPFMGYTTGDSASRAVWELYANNPEIQEAFADVHILTAKVQPVLLQTCKQVRTLDEISGLTIGYPTVLSVYCDDVLQALGVDTKIMSYYEIADKLQDGTLDGTLVTWEILYRLKLYKSAPYMLHNFPVTSLVSVMVMDRSTWDGLPIDIQDDINSVSGVVAAEYFGRELNEMVETKVREAFREYNDVLFEEILSASELAACVEQYGRPQWDIWVKVMESQGLPGRRVIDEAFRLIEEYGGQAKPDNDTQYAVAEENYILPAAPPRQPPPEGATLIVQDGFDNPENSLWPVSDTPQSSLSYDNGEYSIKLNTELDQTALPDLYGLVFTDFVVEADFRRLDDAQNYCGYGLRFESVTGSGSWDVGTTYRFTHDGLFANVWVDEWLQDNEKQTRDHVSSRKRVDCLRIIRMGDTVQVYINDETDPIIDCTLQSNIPVKIGLFAENSRNYVHYHTGYVHFDNIRIYSLDSGPSASAENSN
jgi:TRAP-type C4-dicarboxylate transport system substrate-binding protein